MSLAYYIVLEENKEINLDIDGTSIARDLVELDKIAEEIGVTPLSQFFSVAEESIFELLGESDVLMDIPDESWFKAKDGLHTVQALLKYIKEKNIEVSTSTITDLENFERILKEAVLHNVRWHLAMDI